MDIFLWINLCSGLCLFLFGMYIMSRGLENFTAGNFRRVLCKITNSRFKGLLLGTAVTSVIQSSSATTVMVVGFVNSGVMNLNQSIGIIMGANIGTTVTSWILSLMGIQGDSIMVNLLKPVSLSTIFAIVGVLLTLFSKSSKKHNIGIIFMGFFLLITGMNTMNISVDPFTNMPEFVSFFTMFNNPVFGLLSGALLTAFLQSSSASVGILQSMSLTGTITYGMAIPIVMGQNIGTCVTALISSIGVSRNAKCAALVHLYFNIIGVVILGTGFYGLQTLANFDFVNSLAGPAEIALVHTAFNALSTILIFPFADKLEKLVQFTIYPKLNFEKRKSS